MEDKYKTLTGPELAGEASFIQWIIRGENNSEWTQWKSRNPEVSATVEEAKYIVKTLASFPVSTLNPDEKNALWDKINTSVQKAIDKPSSKTFYIVRLAVAVAAMVALLVWITISEPTQKIITDTAESKEFKLPESSRVMVNSDSKITYHKKKFNDARELSLDGEAFFEVTPGSTFTVKTNQGDVTVVGTSFNVISRPGRFEVSCYTGKVIVSKGTEKAEITAGEKIYAEHQDLKRGDFTPTRLAPWTEGKFTFEDQPLSVVVDELERQYNVKVELNKDLKDIRYIGFFEAGNLDTALYTITWPLNLQYEIRGKSVTISR